MNPRIPLTLLAALLAVACSRQETAVDDSARERADTPMTPGASDPAPNPPPQSVPPTDEVGPDSEPHMVPNETSPAPESPPPESPPPND